jgi:signal transduction histidine kinase
MENKYHYKTLYEIAKEVNSSLSLQEVFNAIAESITKAVGAKGCSLMLLTPDQRQLIRAANYGLSEWYIKKGPLSADTILAEALQGKPVTILNAPEDPRVRYPEEARREGIASMLSIPATLRGNVIGVIRIYTSEPQEFTSDSIDFLSAAADLSAIALEKAKLHELLGEKYENKLEELEKAANELKRLSEERECLIGFLSMTAHDLKAPLAAIQSYLKVMLGGFTGELNEKQRNMLQRSSQRITELLNLISDLLDIARIETGQLVSEMKLISPLQIVEDSLDSIQEIAAQRGIRLSTQMPKRLPLIYASAPRLQQVMTNLLNNAINYSPEGGEVAVAVEERGNETIVKVMDEGIGIPLQELPRVFDDFFRGSNVDIKGSGLGLSIAKRIIEAHGGRIWAVSPRPGSDKGSQFTFTLPKGKRETKVEAGS